MRNTISNKYVWIWSNAFYFSVQPPTYPSVQRFVTSPLQPLQCPGCDENINITIWLTDDPRIFSCFILSKRSLCLSRDWLMFNSRNKIFFQSEMEKFTRRFWPNFYWLLLISSVEFSGPGVVRERFCQVQCPLICKGGRKALCNVVTDCM